MPGLMALLGSGEYLPVMDETDRYLLESVGGAAKARVVLLPTASGLESEGPAYWNGLGERHFKQLGVHDVRLSQIIVRADASDPHQLALLRDADLYYFSGGDPQQIIEVFRDTPAWQIITEGLERGAVFAGCSAGAMAVGGQTFAPRRAMLTSHMAWAPALGLLPQIIVIPHYDRMHTFIDQGPFQKMIDDLPLDSTVLGIDERTALVRIEVMTSGGEHAPSALWQVMGEQNVTLMGHNREQQVIGPGAEVLLP